MSPDAGAPEKEVSSEEHANRRFRFGKTPRRWRYTVEEAAATGDAVITQASWCTFVRFLGLLKP